MHPEVAAGRRFATMREVAALLMVSQGQVRRYVKEGVVLRGRSEPVRLNAVKLPGRMVFRGEDIESFVAALNAIPAAPHATPTPIRVPGARLLKFPLVRQSGIRDTYPSHLETTPSRVARRSAIPTNGPAMDGGVQVTRQTELATG